MRRKNIEKIADTIFWYAVYGLPIFAYIIYVSNPSTTDYAFATFLSTFGASITQNNVVYVALADVFGANGVMPVFANETILQVLAYFANCVIVHLLVDFVLFIPRIAHKWLQETTTGVQ